MAAFLHWLLTTHTKRWHACRGTTGAGHLYQGPYKSFPVQSEGYFLTVCRYVERDPLAAGLVQSAEGWRWSSLRRRMSGKAKDKGILWPWPLEPSADLLTWVNTPLTDQELEAVRLSIRRGRPYGSADWQLQVALKLGCEHTLRPPGRPAKGHA
jgi:putative transposase